MDLDQLDLNPRITAAVKRGMCVVSRAHRHCGQNKLQTLHHPRLVASLLFKAGLVGLARGTFGT